MTRSQLYPLPDYFDRYINLADDVPVLTSLEISLKELETAPVDNWTALGDRVYAPGKWTVKDLLQHIVDTERVFCYRALSFARGEREVKPFDEDLYAASARADRRSLADILEEAVLVRRASLALFRSFTDDMLAKTGKGFKGDYSVHAIGFILAGHQRWHFKVIEDRYFPLLKEK